MKLKIWIGYVRWILLAVFLLAAGFCYSCGSGAGAGTGTEVSLAEATVMKDSAETMSTALESAASERTASEGAATEGAATERTASVRVASKNPEAITESSCCCGNGDCQAELQRMNELLEAVLAGKEVSDPAKININTADRPALMTLPGIGGAKADAITEYRSRHGGFQTIDEIKKVPGVKDAAFQKIKDKITV